MELLLKENIEINCKAADKEQVIRHIGGKLCNSGYVEESYIDAMLLREKSFSTNIGNGIALPHGIEASKGAIRKSGIAVMVFPEGTDWGSEAVKIVIAVAGVGEEHLEILSNIAEILSDLENVVRVINSDRDTIYEIFLGNERKESAL
ncbi:PTS sugar transporter subunit IIA [Clostridium sp. Marseille-P2415]|uniref:PTS sugar transporter subunit IIA n=1 Tax=Clostridium sp. Marseille-P2415 TaxID=1805471 RepID=UPI0009883C01|nr:PTS sugar transporter subunit IIA [Clostridium sp. Marseille-P2415]